MSAEVRLVNDFIAAFYRGDKLAARACLAEDCRFIGPAAEYDSADEYLQASSHAAPMVTDVRRQKIFADGADVCVVHDLHLKHCVRVLPMVEWYHIRHTKIAVIRTFFDTAPFILASRKASAASADAAHTDPVCHMSVEETSAAASRVYGGRTYYFCNPGCAIAFEKEPARFA